MYTPIQLHMNYIYYKNFLLSFQSPTKEQLESLENNELQDVMDYLLSYLVQGIQCLYGYLCGKEFDEEFFLKALDEAKNIMNIIGGKSIPLLCNSLQNIEKFYENIKIYKKVGEKVPHIIFLIGNPGSGKSHIARVISKENTNMRVIKKYSTRPKRKDELSGVPETEAGVDYEKILNMKYKFSFNMGEEKNLCGVDEEEIRKALSEGKNPVIATTSLDLYHQIVQDFPCQTHLIQISNLVFNDNHQEKVFLEQGRNSEEIKNRLGVSAIDDIQKYDYNLRVLVNPISLLKRLSEEEQRKFIFTQLKYILEQFGSSLDLDFEKSEYLSDYDDEYITSFRNTNYLYPFLSGMYDEDLDFYFQFDNRVGPSSKSP